MTVETARTIHHNCARVSPRNITGLSVLKCSMKNLPALYKDIVDKNVIPGRNLCFR